MPCCFTIPPQSRLRLASSPAGGGAFWVRYKHGVQCRTPSRSDRFNGVIGGAGGLRGEIEIFPGPPAKRNYKEAYSVFCLFYSLSPLVPLAATSLDREAFGCFTNSHIKPALKGEVGFALAKAGGVTTRLLLFTPTPQSNLRFASSPFGEPFGALYKLSAKTRGRIASPQLYDLSRSPAVRRISHCSSNISLRFSAISPCVSRISPRA